MEPRCPRGKDLGDLRELLACEARTTRAGEATLAGGRVQRVHVAAPNGAFAAPQQNRQVRRPHTPVGEAGSSGVQRLKIIAGFRKLEVAATTHRDRRATWVSSPLSEQDAQLVAGPSGSILTEVLFNLSQVLAGSRGSVSAGLVPEWHPLTLVLVPDTAPRYHCDEGHDPRA